MIQKLFSALDIPKKEMFLGKKIAQSTKQISKDDKIMRDTQMGFKDHYLNYLKYIDSLKSQQEIEEIQNQLNHQLLSLQKPEDKIKPISFSEFAKKYKNFPFLDYLDYYDIQKINKKEKEREFENFHSIDQMNNRKNNRRLYLKTAKNRNYLNKDSTLFTENNHLIIDNFKNNKCNNSIRRSRKSSGHKNNSNEKNVKNILGLDTKLIKKIQTETNKINQKMQNLKLNMDLNKEKIKNAKSSKINLYLKKQCSSNQTIENKMSNNFKSKKERKLSNLNKQIEKLKKNENNVKSVNTKKDNFKNRSNIYNEKHLYYVDYIPNTSLYKHITFQKEWMFKNEIHPKKKNKYDEWSKPKNFKEHIKYYRTESKLNFSNDKKRPFSKENKNNILYSSNQIVVNSKLIKNILKTDSNYTTRTITAGSNRYKKNNNKNDVEKRTMEREIKNEKYDSPDDIKLIKNDYQKPRKSVFRTLEQISKKFSSENIKLSNDIKSRFNKSLNELCKLEKNEKVLIQKMKKGNFELRAEENKKSNTRLKKMQSDIKIKDHFIKYLTQKVSKEYNDVISIGSN